MELKSYQQKVIENLEEYLEYVQEHKNVSLAFNKYALYPISFKALSRYNAFSLISFIQRLSLSLPSEIVIPMFILLDLFV